MTWDFQNGKLHCSATPGDCSTVEYIQKTGKILFWQIMQNWYIFWKNSKNPT